MAERISRSAPDRGDARQSPPDAPEQLAGAVGARHDDPVVAVDVDRLVAERLDLEQWAMDDVVAELLEPRNELFLLARAAS